jgi:hypothetical protein
VAKSREVRFENLDINREVTVENDEEDEDDDDNEEMKEREEENDARIGTGKAI